MQLDDLSPEEVRKTLSLFAARIGAAQFKRCNPDADEVDAWAWGIAHRRKFASRAVTMLAAVLLADEGPEIKEGHPCPLSVTPLPVPRFPVEAG